MIIEALEPKQIGVAQSEHTTLVSDFAASTISAPSAAIRLSMSAHIFLDRVGLDGERPVAAVIAAHDSRSASAGIWCRHACQPSGKPRINMTRGLLQRALDRTFNVQKPNTVRQLVIGAVIRASVPRANEIVSWQSYSRQSRNLYCCREI